MEKQEIFKTPPNVVFSIPKESDHQDIYEELYNGFIYEETMAKSAKLVEIYKILMMN